MTTLTIKDDDLMGSEIAALLQRHLDHMFAITPAESVFALDIDALRVPEISFWSAYLDGELVGCVALKDHGNGLGEIKSMHTLEKHRGKRIAYHLVKHLIDEARERGLERLSLETGKTEHFMPAQKLYERFGFTASGPFADYGPDPHSYFMTLALA
ncbi:GNAT family N-acetyltransferase [Ahrensia kielensis]|uniref:GNAT family N-acetyltransferase n=1 Tax=Ahrensia kielensis TaxID=76980 RepID=UPI000370ABA1|nr:GNAT family N-acetyltransferase [Ahrensia kielensis]